MAGIASLPLLGCASNGSSEIEPTDTQIEVSGKTLRYVKAGSGPNVILLHGASGNLHDWTFDLFDALAQSYTVLAFDRPGLGLSDAADDASLLAQSRLMREAAETLGMKQATLVGHSFGGSVALAWALDAPSQVDGLVLMSAPSHVWPGSAGPLYDIAGLPLIGYAFSQLVPLLASDSRVTRAVDTIFAPQETPDGYVTHVRPDLSTRPQNFRNNAAQVGSLKPQIRDMVPRYPSLTMPIEVIHGTADEIVPLDIHSEPMASTLSNARLTRLEGIGHMPHHTNPDVLFAALARIY